MNGKLIFTKYEKRSLALLFQKDRLIAAQVLPEGENRIGAIYIGKVKNVTPNINACFVEIADGEICFLPLKEAANPFLLNRKFDGRVLAGDELVVQITKEAQKTKQTTVTARISFSNDYFALCVDTSSHAGFSGKLSKAERNTLQTILAERGILQSGNFSQEETLPLTIGGVVRTRAGEYLTENGEALQADELITIYHSLRTEFVSLLNAAMHRTCFTCLKEAPHAYEAILGTFAYPDEYEEIVTDNSLLYEQLSAYCKNNLPGKTVRLYGDVSYPLNKLYSVETKLKEALGKRVWLKSGGYLIIEPTEALTVIDVNSGKYEGLENAYKVNLEAASEIALQLRLRNLSGMILVDFINMASKEKEEILLRTLRKLVNKDKQKTLVIDITPLGLMEITRKKGVKPLHEQFQKG